ncbi:hypothetical protein A2765_03860 [Candidatus Kaiserbacteria bacterium RIFCSPHIGHO2_01_FULL_56_24]|uniref:Type 4 fimbrial biogenesis protein PilX N-terminal domain-containing protein n=1 Tax=Candidatus Kaiserbacteria bacterium RIFCSPHIGHO2_01_FULL_56_24 TaxID=1798487 RepID=A0A1F6D8Y5_9BACT|nr:MAG: hypothetical protein A2765_03860 [Candidatus Kaiserbacteria bacterium RIFCSPHIGHO2_01_FULL_56_24]
MIRVDADKGFILLIALVFGAVLIASGASVVSYTTLHARSERIVLASTQALAIAEAGVDKAIYELNRSDSYDGESGTALGAGTLTIAISNIDGNRRRITATGYVPDSVNPAATRVVEVDAFIDTDTISFHFGVQVGEGGVSMSNSSRINGNIFSNGSISGSNSASISGDATVAGGEPVLDQSWTTQMGEFNIGDTSAHGNVAQSFTPSVSGPLNKVSLYLRKSGSPSNLSIRILADNNGSPSKTTLATGSIAASTVTASYNFVDGGFSSSPYLVAGQTYWVVAIASVSSSNYYSWGMDTAMGYAAGAAKHSSNWNASTPVWTAIPGDLNFKAHMGVGGTTSISGIMIEGNAWAQGLSNCTVQGNAQYQSISNCPVQGTQYAGAEPSAPGVMPISEGQIEEWKTAAEEEGVTNGSVNISGSETQTLGPRKINGDLTMSTYGILYLSGPVWVNGNISLSNSAQVIVADSVGNSGVALIADSTDSGKAKITVSNSTSFAGNGAGGSFPLLISMKTGDDAIQLSNTADGVILYAPRGTIEVTNTGEASQITAYRLELSNTATVNYLTGLQNASFSSGPGGSWTTTPGTYTIVK